MDSYSDEQIGQAVRSIHAGGAKVLKENFGLLPVEDKDEGRRLIKTKHQIEAEGSDKPAAYVEYLNLWWPR